MNGGWGGCQNGFQAEGESQGTLGVWGKNTGWVGEAGSFWAQKAEEENHL